MDVSTEELAKRFAEMSDEELLGLLRSGDLTPRAQGVATSILNSRGITPSSVPGDAEITSAESVHGEDLSDTAEMEMGGELSDLEATQEIQSLPAREQRVMEASLSTSGSWRPPTAQNPVAPEKKGILGRILVLAIGVGLALWLWITLTH